MGPHPGGQSAYLKGEYYTLYKPRLGPQIFVEVSNHSIRCSALPQYATQGSPDYEWTRFLPRVENSQINLDPYQFQITDPSQASLSHKENLLDHMI